MHAPSRKIAECEFADGADAGGDVGGGDLHDEQRVTARGVRVDVMCRHTPVLVPSAHHIRDLHSHTHSVTEEQLFGSHCWLQNLHCATLHKRPDSPSLLS